MPASSKRLFRAVVDSLRDDPCSRIKSAGYEKTGGQALHEKAFDLVGERQSRGGVVIDFAANGVMHFVGLSASYNIGDPSKFEFRLI